MKRKYGSCIPRFHPCKYVYYDGSKETQDFIVATLKKMMPHLHLDWIKVKEDDTLIVKLVWLDRFTFVKGYVYTFGKDMSGFPLPISIGNFPEESIAVFEDMYKEIDE